MGKFTWKQLADTQKLQELKIAGIDLVASDTKYSGFCILDGDEAVTMRLKSDEAMIAVITYANVDLVSIDSPLGLPTGRKSCFDDDPGREKYGTFRECERILRSRGINLFQCLIPSMQKLTNRGIKLASKLRKAGFEVIESFPGGTQDILGIPRKQAGMDHLKQGLKNFGIRGDYLDSEISHDELDAITCAITGLFYKAGRYEAVGDPQEGQIIVPLPGAVQA
ncbi:MAG: DUF429 domain-containing protein [Desulfovibrio sp.]|nr:DUF429 domain-containing protein [Desulfovibrio sp.]